MEKKYIFYLIFCFLSLAISAQEGRPSGKGPDAGIEGLSFYPNPVNNGKIYITSKSALDKQIEIFDVLGKKVLQATANSREVNVSNLPPGVYVIKISENESTATRKLIIK